MSIELSFAKIQSLGEKLDHLALQVLSQDSIDRYLIAKNHNAIVFKQQLHQDTLAEKNSKEHKPVENSVADDSETQIIQRPSRAQINNGKTIQNLTDALDNDLSCLSLWLERGNLWQEEGNYAAALSDYLRAYHLDTNNPAVHQSLAQLQKLCSTQGKQIDLSKYIVEK